MNRLNDVLADEIRTDRGPRAVAEKIERSIAELEVRLADGCTRGERRRINKALHTQRDLLRWCKTRAGY